MEERIEYRCYTIVNRALSSIQKGVQGAHSIVELFGCDTESDIDIELVDWAANFKTLILLEGGFHRQMEEDFELLQKICGTLMLPHAVFYEDEETMNGMCTAFSVIVSSIVYDMNVDEEIENIQGNLPMDVPDPMMVETWVSMQPDLALKLFLNRYNLAR